MAHFDYSNKETLLINLRGFKNVYQKSDPYVHGHDPKVSETGLTLSVTILVASRNAAILLDKTFILNYNPRATCFGQAPIILLRITHSSKSLEIFLQGKMCSE